MHDSEKKQKKRSHNLRKELQFTIFLGKNNFYFFYFYEFDFVLVYEQDCIKYTCRFSDNILAKQSFFLFLSWPQTRNFTDFHGDSD